MNRIAKYMLAVSFLAVGLPAHAGFLTGVIVGKALSSSGESASHQSTGYILVASDDNDVITCPAVYPAEFIRIHSNFKELRDRNHVIPPLPQGPVCGLRPNPNSTKDLISADEYIHLMGYSTVHKVGQLFSPGGYVLWVFEVSKN